MSDNKTLVILWLSVQTTILTALWVRAEKHCSYLEGRQSVQAEIDNAVNDAVGPYSVEICKGKSVRSN